MVGQPITDPVSGSSLDVSKTLPGVNQDVREDPKLDNISISVSLKFLPYAQQPFLNAFDISHFLLAETGFNV